MFGHFPSVFLDHSQLRADSTSGNAVDHDDASPPPADDFWAVLRARNASMYLCGHTHRRVLRRRADALPSRGLPAGGDEAVRQGSGLGGEVARPGPWELQLDDWKDRRVCAKVNKNIKRFVFFCFFL